MAITKLMHMKAAKKGDAGNHLKNAIDYILKESKVAKEDGIIYKAAQGCMAGNAYNDMMNTKKSYGKTDGRQGYHFVIAFAPGEVTKEQLWNITQDFVKEYLSGYEVVYAMHDDADHLHTHIIFNSVNYRTGYKYHYKNGDWERNIQPIVDRLCMENDAPVLTYHIDEEDYNGEKKEFYTYSKKINWTKEVKGDIDNCINSSRSWNEFVKNMQEKGYRFNFGKSVSIRKSGMRKAKRLKEKTMGFEYTPEGIIERIHFRTGKARLNVSVISPQAGGIKNVPDVIHTSRKYKKYKDMSFEEKVMIRQMLRIKNVIPEYKKYPGSWASKRKTYELQRAAQELVMVKQYKIHSADDIESRLQTLHSVEKEMKQQMKKEDLKMEQAMEIKEAYELLDNAEDTEEKSKDNEQIKKAEELTEKSPYKREDIEIYISEYEYNSEKTEKNLQDIKKQKNVLYRLKKKYDSESETEDGRDKDNRLNRNNIIK